VKEAPALSFFYMRPEGRHSYTRLDADAELRARILPLCRLAPGEIWEDPVAGHRVGCLDAADPSGVAKLTGATRAALLHNDPPYNLAVGRLRSEALSMGSLEEYLEFSRAWVGNALSAASADSSFYVWMGADQNAGFQPLPDFMVMMRSFGGLESRSFITMRNQRGFGTQRNWMALRQELLYYTRGRPAFNPGAEYTDIPRLLQGYYKVVGGVRRENGGRSRSPFLRAGNVWVDVQQTFYRMEEFVPGAYAQKPLKAIERIVAASSGPRDAVLDLFSHSGTTLLACERTGRRCLTCDADPLFAELTIRRLERFRATGRTGWQFESPFPEAAGGSGRGA
jgi:DNA modification methylase